MIRCMIIDDEPHAAEVLEHYIAQISQLKLVATCSNPVEALSFLQENAVDCIFLDIHMPRINGLDFIRTIQNRYKVVLCTAYPEYALEGFDLNVIDYLVKPIPLPRFLRTVQKLVASTPAVPPSAGDFILVPTGVRGNMTRITIADITHIKARQHYVDIHHKEGHTLALLSMKELEERLPAPAFVRIQRSFIVAIQEIMAIEGNEITLRNARGKFPIGESYKANFFAEMKGRVLGRD